jgi:hypothetical protein
VSFKNNVGVSKTDRLLFALPYINAMTLMTRKDDGIQIDEGNI